jgi:glutamate-ammonia-ligase adenylyltransferase
MFRDAPDRGRNLCVLLGTSRLITTGLEHHPDFLSTALPPPPTPVDDALRWRPPAEQVAALRRVQQREELRIEMQDVLGATPVSGDLTALAEEVVREALSIAASITGVDIPLAVIAMGRFGGAELSYASDLDLMVVHDGDQAAAERLVAEFRRIVDGDTPAARIYALDFDLRPEGKQGPLTRSLAGYEQYYARWAQTWERQALLRGRVVAGSVPLGEAFADTARAFLARPVTEDDEREIRRMKARIERERIPSHDDPDFHLKLGRGGLADVEWTVQLLQLRHHLFGYAGTMDALAELEGADLIAVEDASALRSAYVFCEHTRNRLYLVRGAPGDALPSRPEQLGKLARSLGTTSAALRDDYRRVTRRAREVTERLFYERHVLH